MKKASNIKDIYELTPMQEGMLFDSMLSSKLGTYFEQTVFTITADEFDVKVFNESFNKVICKYDALRTSFIYENVDRPKQVVLNRRSSNIYYNDISCMEELDRSKYLEQYKKDDINKGFDLFKDPLIRIAILKTENDIYKIILSFHHIIMDGWCIGIILKDLFIIYDALKSNKSIEIVNGKPFGQYIKWLQKQDKKEAMNYWNEYLKTYDKQILIPKYDTKKEEGYNLKYHTNKINIELSKKIKELAAKNNVTLNTVMQSLWAIVLQRYNNTNDVVFGSVISGRPSEIDGIENMVGLFINTVPIRIKTDLEETFESLIKKVQEDAVEAERYGYCSLAEIQNLTPVKQALINHITVFENYPIDEGLVDGELFNFNIKDVEAFEKNNYDFNITFLPGEEISIMFSYNSFIYNDEIIINIGKHINEVIQAIVEDSRMLIKDISIISEAEKSKIINVFNNTEVEYPKEKNLQRLFEEQAERTPDNIAVVYEEKKLTYKQLNKMANSLARMVREKGVKPDTIVGIMTDRSLDMIIGILSILKAGGAYLPIDPKFPKDRIQYMIEDSNVSLLLTQKNIEILKNTLDIINIDDSSIYEDSDENIENINSSRDLAYVIYTSGTTGKPKGTMIEHRSVINLAECLRKVCYEDRNDLRAAMLSSYIFDASVQLIFTCLLSGSTLFIVPDDVKSDGEKMLQFYQENSIDVSDGTPSNIRILCSSNRIKEKCSVKLFIIGGEKLTNSMVENLLYVCNNKQLKVINVYGPTECCVNSSYYEIDTSKLYEMNIIPIGKPLNNLMIHILGTNNKLQPIGVAGELCVSGDALSRGYINRPELTAEKFVDNPFKPGEKMYRTGDLARWLPSGNLEYLGRIDQQVKIRGFRIELGEIEAQLIKYGSIKDAVVIAYDDGSDSKYLCAYIVTNTDVKVSEIREHLAKELPTYMIPSYFISIDHIPLMPGGKLDEKSLPKPDMNIETEVEYEVPIGEIEEKLVKVWQDVLNIENIGVNDSFFDLGGDSIKAVQISSRLYKYRLKIEINDLYKHPRIKELSNYVKKLSVNINQGEVEGRIELTPIQRWFFDSLLGKMNHFNQSFMLHNENGFDESALKITFTNLVKHHDVLRTTYKITEEVEQYNNGVDGELFKLKIINLCGQDDINSKVEYEANKIQSGIDLERGPLVHLGLFKTDDGDHLLIVIHHLVIDGVSWRILFEDFSKAYMDALAGRKIKLQNKTHSFKEWSEKLNKYADSTKLLKEVEYWRKISESKVLPLPCDNVIEKDCYSDSESFEVKLSSKDTEILLKDVNNAYNTEINDILLIALALAVKEWASIGKLRIDLESMGRENILKDMDITRTIGWFTTTYPILLDVSEVKDIGQYIKEIKETLRKVPHKGIGYGVLKYLSKNEINNLFVDYNAPEILFNYLGQFDSDINTEIFKKSNLPMGHQVDGDTEATHHIEINGIILDKQMSLQVRYNKYQYEHSTIERFAKLYEENLIKLISYCSGRIETEKTPYDMTYKELSIDTMEEIIKRLEEDISNNIEISDIYSLSPLQDGLLFHSLLDKSSGGYIEQIFMSINGEFDLDIYEKSIQSLTDKYDVFRAIILHEGMTRPIQIILKEFGTKISYKDLCEYAEGERKLYVDNFIKEDRYKGFNLSKENLVRTSVFKIDEKQYNIILTFHHIIMDGWCIGIVLKDLFENYHALKRGKTYTIENLYPYGNYIEWLEEQDKDIAYSYWKNYLNGYEQKAIVPKSNKVDERNIVYKNEELEFKIGEVLTNGLTRLSRKTSVTINTIIQCVWGIILQKYNNVNDVVFGAVVSGRSADVKGIENMVGLFINTIPVRITSNKDMSFNELIKQVQEQALESAQYDYVQLAQIQSESLLKQELINNIIVFENYPIQEEGENIINSDELGFQLKDIKALEQTNYAFTMIVEPDENMNIKINYNANVYSKNFIESISYHIIQTIEEVIGNNRILLKDIEIISESEKKQLLYDFNLTEAEYPRMKTLHKLFEEQVEKTPNNIAILFKEESLTYKQLNEKANSLAYLLKKKGVKSGDIIGIMVERSIEMVIGIMAILKAGGAYMPISVEYPIDRIEFMLSDSDSKVLLTQTRFMDNVDFKGEIIDIRSLEVCINEKENLGDISTPEDLAYIIYTSGSTGKPKGVMIEHKAIVNRINWMQRKYPIGKGDVILQKTPYTFDVSVWELLWWSMVGASVCMLGQGEEKDPEEIIKAISKYEITTMHFVPSMLSIFLDYAETLDNITQLKTLKRIFASGEALNTNQVDKFNKLLFKENGTELTNLYGPTEAAVDVSYFDCSNEKNYENIPIGKPIDNIKLYIMDSYGHLNPIGIAGELHIGGIGLARGYLNRPELTKEKFIINPMRQSERIYKTGDLARWLPDGNIEYLGRIDDQVKIRGFRIELGEIEAELLKYELVNEAIVTAYEDGNGAKSLCAYIVSKDEIRISELKEHLSKQLPEYMIPSYFMKVDMIPINANGKVDRKALPKPDGSINTRVAYEAPSDEIEEILVKVWQEVLLLDNIGINDSFFDLGGDSIKAVQISSRLYRYNLKMEIRDLYKYQKIRELSKYVTKISTKAYQGSVKGEVGLTPIQKYFFEASFKNINYFNQSFMLYRVNGFNENAVKLSFSNLLKHHDALRMVYQIGEQVQQYNRDIEGGIFNLKVIDFRGENNINSKIEMESNKIQQGINIEDGPLVNLGLFKTDEGDHLLIVIHHLVIDGVSWRILFEDFAQVYSQIISGQSISLHEKTHSFKEWSKKLYAYANSSTLLEELDYWKKIVDHKVLPLPYDEVVEEDTYKDSSLFKLELSEEDTKVLLKDVNQAYNTEINDILLTSLGLALKKWSNNEKIRIDLESMGREEILKDIDISRTIGWFTTTYPILLDLDGEKEIGRYIKDVKESLRRIPHKGIGFGILKYISNDKVDNNFIHDRESDILFNYLGQFDSDINTEIFEISDLPMGNQVDDDTKASHPIEINGIIINGRLSLQIRYNKQQYKDITISNLAQLYKENLRNIIEYCANRKETEKTPYDMTYKGLSIDELDNINEQLANDISTGNQIKDIYELTPLQDGLLFHTLLDQSSGGYIEQICMSISGEFDLEIYNKSMEALTERYDIFRAIILHEGRENRLQVILENRTTTTYYEELSGCSEEEKKEYIINFKKKDRFRGFDLYRDTLVRSAILKVDENHYEVIITFHHIIMDGWCIGIVLKDLFGNYRALRQGRTYEPGVLYPYGDYLEWLDKQDKKAAYKYWEVYLDDYEQQASIPQSNKVDSKNITYNHDEITFKVNERLTRGMERLARKSSVTLSTIFQSIWGVLLQKYNNTDDVVFGAVVSGRSAEVKGIENIVGLFINTIPVRISSKENMTFEELIKNAQNSALESAKYDYVQLAQVQSQSLLKQDLIDNIIAFENYPVEQEGENIVNSGELGFKLNDIKALEQTSYPFGIAVEPGKEMSIKFIYNANLYAKELIESISWHIIQTIKQVVENNEILVKDIDIIPEVEKNKLLCEFNDTEYEYEKNKTLHLLFQEQVQKTPNNIAIIYNDEKLTYNELNSRANSLAKLLRGNNIQPDTIVGIMVERSIEMIVAILGVLKSGAAYLPIDSELPSERISYMLEDSNVKILLTQRALIDKAEFKGKIIDLNNEDIYSESTENLEPLEHSRNLAYLIYTSGTTGKAKGTMVEHQSIINTVLWRIRNHKFNENDTMLQMLSYNFDGSLSDIFPALLSGARLVLVNSNRMLDMSYIKQIINKWNVNSLLLTPSLYKTLLTDGLEEINTISKVTLAGESLQEQTVREHFEHFPEASLTNEYGPTECSICATSYKVLKDCKKVLIGKPISNVQLYVLDNKEKLVPIGVQGELCIGGAGLARGYLNNDKLTAEKFTANPYIPGEKMYKTGDLVRWLPDGNIEFLGRIDHQVKIRGYRMELGEIEACLLKHDNIKNAVVIVNEEESGNKFLCGYIVCNTELFVNDIKQYLSNLLPEYMIPSYFVIVDNMPLTSNGKVDVKALPKYDVNVNVSTAYEEPINETEQKLMVIWKDILELDKPIGVNDDFFELGGHSLRATMMGARVYKEFDIEIPLGEIFNLGTIKKLGQYISANKVDKFEEIDKIQEQDLYESSSAQKRMYVMQELDKDKIAYNIPMIFKLQGKVNIEKVKHAFRKLVIRHESLRTSFVNIEESIFQKIHDDKEIDFSFEQFKVNSEREADEIIKVFVRPFDLNLAPLFRVGIIQLAKESHILILDMHHAISDGVSMSILLKEFSQIYSEKEQLTPVSIQYKDYAAWQSKRKDTEKVKKQEEYWLKEFAGDIPVINLPTDYERQKIKDFSGKSVVFALDKEITKKLRGIVKETGSTMYMLLLANINILLSKYTGQEDIVVGSPIAGRNRKDLENVVGMFVNTLAMRTNVDRELTFKEYLNVVREKALNNFENQEYQFDELVDKVSVNNDLSRNPLFDVMFVLQNIEEVAIKIEDLTCDLYNSSVNVEKFDITIGAIEEEEEIYFNLSYATSLYKEKTIERMIKHFSNIVRQVVEDTEIKVKDIEIVDEEEKHKLLVDFNDTMTNYPQNKTIDELFEEQVEKTPYNIAVSFENNQLTYKELNERANSLATILRENGVGPDTIVGIMVERSIEMIVGIIAILKAGGAYLPIDPGYPKDRIEYMLKNSETKILLTQMKFKDNLSFDMDIYDLRDESLYLENKNNLGKISNENNIAYIIYTSGTTGMPKGVMIEHHNLVRLMFNDKMQYDFNENDIWTMSHSFCFDFSVWEMYGALLYGGKLVIVPKLIAQNTVDYLNLLNEENVTVLNQTPTAFYNLIEEELKVSEKNLQIRYVIFGGEALKPIKLKEWKSKYSETKLINMYGITETTVHVTFKEITENDIENNISNIGKPIPTLTTYVMDKNMKLVPVGLYGELCVGGDGVARGYLNNEDLTLKKFIQNPYKPEERMYRSGDLVKMLPNGEMEYLGRIDDQVKIRGFRIELGEIENKLLNNPYIKEAVVIVREQSDSDRYLCAYIILEKEITISEIREYLLNYIPEYMIPSYFIRMKSIPLTFNGKIDKKALPEPSGNIDSGVEYEAPRNKLEEKLVIIWENILGVNNIGINDNFFVLGGHSLKATALLAKIHKDLKVKVPLKEIFSRGSIKGLSEYILSLDKDEYEEIKATEEKEYYEVSAAQKRMYMLQKYEAESIAYNVPEIIEINGELDFERLNQSFIKLLERHESLRTSFEIEGNMIVQKVKKMEDIEFQIEEVFVNDENDIEKKKYEFIRPFDLRKAPLIRVGIIKLEEKKNILLLDMHHCICDGISLGIIIDEFGKLYDGIELDDLHLQYKDYAEWQNKSIKQGRIKQQEEYWIKEFDGGIPMLQLPTDFTRPEIKSFEGNNISFVIDEELTVKLKDLSKDTETTMQILLLAAFNVLLFKYSGENDIVVGTPISGRTHTDFEGIVGMMVNMLAIRSNISENETFENYIYHIKDKSLNAYTNQDYPFDYLIQKLKIKRDNSRNPLFDVVFSLENYNEQKLEMENLILNPVPHSVNKAKYDILLSAVEFDEKIYMDFNYCTELFKEETILRMVDHMKNILNQIAVNKTIFINDISVFNEDEEMDLSENINSDFEDEINDIGFTF